LARWIETLPEFDYTVEHRPGRLHSNADGLSRPFCKQCYDRPNHIPGVDELQRADAAVGPWSVHLLEIAPEMTNADVAKLQEEDEILGPVKSMLSHGYSPTLDDLRALPLEGRKLWSYAAHHHPPKPGPGPMGWRCRPTGGATVFAPPAVHSYACRPTCSPFGLTKNVGAITPPLLLAWHA